MHGKRLVDVITMYAQAPATTLPGSLATNVAVSPRCAVTRYLLGCQCFDRGYSAMAVRHMMVAHHVEPQLQSAALLVFAGLNWVSQRGAKLLPVLLETWEEFRRPEFDCYPRERHLLDAFAEPDPGLEHVSLLAQRLWRLPIRTLRSQILAAILSRDAGLSAYLMAPA